MNPHEINYPVGAILKLPGVENNKLPYRANAD